MHITNYRKTHKINMFHKRPNKFRQMIIEKTLQDSQAERLTSVTLKCRSRSSIFELNLDLFQVNVQAEFGDPRSIPLRGIMQKC
jgi:hypothetical protein